MPLPRTLAPRITLVAALASCAALAIRGYAAHSDTAATARIPS